MILFKDTEKQTQIIQTICHLLNNDELSLAKYLSTIYAIPDSEFYVKITIFSDLKLITTIIVTIIPLIISIIQLTIEINKI